MTSRTIDDLSPLAAGLRAGNADCYLSTLFAAPARREALIALYAFDGEIARVRHAVREPMAGLIRLQWWDDVVDRLAAAAPSPIPWSRDWPAPSGITAWTPTV